MYCVLLFYTNYILTFLWTSQFSGKFTLWTQKSCVLYVCKCYVRYVCLYVHNLSTSSFQENNVFHGFNIISTITCLVFNDTQYLHLPHFKRPTPYTKVKCLYSIHCVWHKEFVLPVKSVQTCGSDGLAKTQFLVNKKAIVVAVSTFRWEVSIIE